MKTDFVLVYTTTGHILAGSIVALLKSFGITAYTSQESAGIAYGLTVGSLGMARIYVQEDQLEDARRILDQMDRGEFQVMTTDDPSKEDNQEEETGSIEDE